jgi:4-hydroxy-3-methylbut-2-enyl diphosphate reductase IspH
MKTHADLESTVKLVRSIQCKWFGFCVGRKRHVGMAQKAQAQTVIALALGGHVLHQGIWNRYRRHR